jgi:hypothetical protein
MIIRDVYQKGGLPSSIKWVSFYMFKPLGLAHNQLTWWSFLKRPFWYQKMADKGEIRSF